jgi:hypothetical protein
MVPHPRLSAYRKHCQHGPADPAPHLSPLRRVLPPQPSQSPANALAARMGPPCRRKGAAPARAAAAGREWSAPAPVRMPQALPPRPADPAPRLSPLPHAMPRLCARRHALPPQPPQSPANALAARAWVRRAGGQGRRRRDRTDPHRRALRRTAMPPRTRLRAGPAVEAQVARHPPLGRRAAAAGAIVARHTAAVRPQAVREPCPRLRGGSSCRAPCAPRGGLRGGLLGFTGGLPVRRGGNFADSREMGREMGGCLRLWVPGIARPGAVWIPGAAAPGPGPAAAVSRQRCRPGAACRHRPRPRPLAQRVVARHGGPRSGCPVPGHRGGRRLPRRAGHRRSRFPSPREEFPYRSGTAEI